MDAALNNNHPRTPGAIDLDSLLPPRPDFGSFLAVRWASERDAISAARAVQVHLTETSFAPFAHAVSGGGFEAGIVVMRPNAYSGAIQRTNARVRADREGQVYLYMSGITGDLSAEAHWIEDLSGNTVYYIELPA